MGIFPTVQPPSTTGQGSGGGFFQNLIDGIGSGLGNVFGSGAGNIASGIGGLGLLTGAYNRLGNIGEQALDLGQDLAQTQIEQAAFRPYTVSTSTGGQFGTTVDPVTGQLTTSMAVSPEEQAFRNQMFGGAGQFFQQAATPTAEREAAVYDRMRAVMAPEEQRQQLALEERLANQGRLGVRTAQFGGAPEQFAMAQAQEEARNRAMLGAMGQAQAEQMQQAQLGGQFLGSSYLPQQMLLQGLSPGQTAASQAQQAQLYGTGLFGEATASGIEGLLNAGLGQSQLMGTVGTGLLSGLFR